MTRPAIDVGDTTSTVDDPASPARLRMFVRSSRFGLSIVLSFLLLDSHVVGRLRYHVGLLSYPLDLYKCFPTLRGVIPIYDPDI